MGCKLHAPYAAPFCKTGRHTPLWNLGSALLRQGQTCAGPFKTTHEHKALGRVLRYEPQAT